MPPVRSSMLGMRAGGWAAAAPAPRPPACWAWREARRHSAAKSRNISEKSSGNYCIREGGLSAGRRQRRRHVRLLVGGGERRGDTVRRKVGTLAKNPQGTIVYGKGD